MGEIHPISSAASAVDVDGPIIRADRGFCPPWHGCRELLAQLDVDPSGEPALVELLGAASSARVRLPSFMSHSPALQAEVSRAWVRLLGPALGERPLVLLDAAMLDPASLGVIAQLGAARMFVDIGPRSDELHDGRSHDRGHTALSLAFAQLGRGAPMQPRFDLPTRSSHPHDRDAERTLWSELVAGRPVAAHDWLTTIERCFDFQGFAGVLRLGERIDDFADGLDRESLARAHTLIGLAAYARHVESRASAAIGEFMAAHFSRALELEDDRPRRAALLQRMSIVAARRRGELDVARRWAEQAVAESERVSSDAARFVEAWSRNALAFALARLDRVADARAQMELALARLRALALDSPELPRGERALAELVFIDNRIELALLATDHDAALELQAELAARELALFGRDELATVRKIGLLATRLDRTDECAELARSYAARFRRQGDPINELYCLARAAELGERRRDAREILAAQRRALALRRELASESAIATTRLRIGLAHWRLGELESARAELERCIAAAEGPTTASAEALAALARITGEHGSRTAAEQLGERAIDAATELGDARTVLRVALWLIELCELLDDRENAEHLIAEARRIAVEFPESLTLGERCWLAVVVRDPELLPATLDLAAALAEPELGWRSERLLALRERA